MDAFENWARRTNIRNFKKGWIRYSNANSKEVIPHILSGSDIVGQARTGTGKTAAFGLPTIQKIKPGAGLQALVITPTRELASQVSEELYRLALTEKSVLRQSTAANHLNNRSMRFVWALRSLLQLQVDY